MMAIVSGTEFGAMVQHMMNFTAPSGAFGLPIDGIG
jgi:hypothetical protein